jgi:DHA1 family inner membrane transport protein
MAFGPNNIRLIVLFAIVSMACVTSTERPAPLPVLIWVLTAAVTVIGAQAVVPGTLLIDIAQTLHTAPGFLGTVFAAYGLALGCTSVVAASVFASVPLRTRLSAGLLTLALALVVIGAAPSWVGILVGVVLAGIAGGVALPTVYALVPSLVEDTSTTRAMSRTLLGWALAFVVGAPLAGTIASWSSWRMAFFVLAASAAVNGATALRLPLGDPLPPARGNARAVLGDRNMVLLLIGVAAFMATFYGTFAFIGTAAREQLGQGPWLSSTIALAYGAGFGLGSMAGRWAERHQRVLLPITFATLIAIYALLPLTNQAVIAVLLITVGWGFINELCLTTLLTRIGRHPRAAYALALYNTVTYLAAAVGTAGAATLFTRYGFTAIGIAAVVVTIGGLLVILLAGRATNKGRPLSP